MANKNTKSLRKAVSAESKRGNAFVEYGRPVPNYHSYTGPKEGRLIKTLCPTAAMKGDGVNSVNKSRNSCQRIYLNRADGGATSSLTAHEPFLKHEPMRFPNHSMYKDWEYRRGPVNSVSATAVAAQ